MTPPGRAAGLEEVAVGAGVEGPGAGSGGGDLQVYCCDASHKKRPQGSLGPSGVWRPEDQTSPRRGNAGLSLVSEQMRLLAENCGEVLCPMPLVLCCRVHVVIYKRHGT